MNLRIDLIKVSCRILTKEVALDKNGIYTADVYNTFKVITFKQCKNILLSLTCRKLNNIAKFLKLVVLWLLYRKTAQQHENTSSMMSTSYWKISVGNVLCICSHLR